MSQRHSREGSRGFSVASVGWVFADLLLALAMLFLLANTITIKPPPPPPVLTITPNGLSAKDCTGKLTALLQCRVMVSETRSSQGDVSWTAKTDIDNTVTFSSAGGTLSPGKSVLVTISSIPCHNGSFTFSGSRGANPVTILWHCTPPPDHLDFNVQRFLINNVDYNGLLNNSQSADDYIKSQVAQVGFLHGRSVGFAIVYGGAPTASQSDISQAQAIAGKVYDVLKSFGKEEKGRAFQNAAYYGPLYGLGNAPDLVVVDVYLFAQ